jgi:hypothetical protein
MSKPALRSVRASVFLFHLALVSFLTLVPACSSAVSAIVGSITVYCNVASGGTEASCVASRNFPSSEQSTLQSDCTKNGGTVVNACPTSGVVGCCTQSETVAAATVEVETCSYTGSASALKSQCSGTWSTTP